MTTHPLPVLLLALTLLSACSSHRDDTVVRTETTTTTVRTDRTTTDVTPVSPSSDLDQCFLLLHDLPLIQAAPQRHLAIVPARRDVLPNEVFIDTLPAGTRLRLTHVQDYEGKGGAEARFTFARIEAGPHAGRILSTDRIGLNYAGVTTTAHVRAVPCP